MKIRVISESGTSPVLDLMGREAVVDLELQQWREVEIPLELLRPPGAIGEIMLWGNLEGTFYLDNLGLGARAGPSPITAVLREQLAAGPQDFALEQNVEKM